MTEESCGTFAASLCILGKVKPGVAASTLADAIDLKNVLLSVFILYFHSVLST